MNEPKIILVVSYKLGTANGVGGRRWLNYGLELIKQGYDVFFITYQKNIPEELLAFKHKVFIITGNYPEVLNRSPITLLEKLLYRFYLFFLSWRNQGNTFDTAIRTKKQFISLAGKIIEENKISHVIISGAPFSLLNFGTVIKKKYPYIKLISDYRDAWTNGIGYGIPNLSKKKLEFELKHEKEVHNVSDKIIVASEDIVTSLRQITPDINPVVLLNFVNSTTFESSFNEKNKMHGKNCIYITHIGSVNQGTENYWQHFLEKADKFNQQNEKKIKCRFIGGQLSLIKSNVLEFQFSFVEFLPHIPIDELRKYMLESDMFVLFKNDRFPDSFPTKFFEYIYFRKPLLCYSIRGTVTDEIKQNKLGLIFNENITQEQFNEDIIQLFNKTEFNEHYNYEKFMLPNLTKGLIRDILN